MRLAQDPQPVLPQHNKCNGSRNGSRSKQRTNLRPAVPVAPWVGLVGVGLRGRSCNVCWPCSNNWDSRYTCCSTSWLGMVKETVARDHKRSPKKRRKNKEKKGYCSFFFLVVFVFYYFFENFVFLLSQKTKIKKGKEKITKHTKKGFP
eukprot:PhF_6_TR7028/c0_g1_i1/m.10521